MAIAYSPPAPTLKQSPNRVQKSITLLLRPVYLLRAFVWRFFWHIRAYSTIVGIMVLALVSLGFLWLYEAGRKFIQSSAVASPPEEFNPSNQK